MQSIIEKESICAPELPGRFVLPISFTVAAVYEKAVKADRK